MKRLNNRGYMLVEIIVASVIAFSVAYYLLNLTYKFKDKSEDIYYSTTMLSDKINITKNIMNDLEKIPDKNSVSLVKATDNNTYTITIKGKDDKKIEISRTIKLSKDATTQQWQIEYGSSFRNGMFVTNNDKSYYKKVLDKSFEVSNVICEPTQNGAYAYKIIIEINSLYTNDSNDIILFVNKGKSPSNTQNEDFSSEKVTIKIPGISENSTVKRTESFLVEQPKPKPDGKENFVLLGYSTNEKATNPEYKAGDSIDIKGFNNETTLYPIWIIDPEQTFNIASTTVNTNYKWVLDVDHGTNKNGTLVTLYGKHYGENQKWKFEYDKGSGNYRIHSGVDFDNMCLDVNGAKFVNGTQVQIWGCNTSAAQEFKLVTNGDGSYGFSVAADTMYLDVKGGKFSSGTQIQIYQKNGTNAQKWELLPIINN